MLTGTINSNYEAVVRRDILPVAETFAMALLETRYEHVALGEDGVPRIVGTGTKIIELVLDKLAYGWSPEDIQFQHPYLTLGQVYSALAYYPDHRQELDRDIEDRLRQVDKIQAAAEPTPLVARLKAKV